MYRHWLKNRHHFVMDIETLTPHNGEMTELIAIIVAHNCAPCSCIYLRRTLLQFFVMDRLCVTIYWNKREPFVSIYSDRWQHIVRSFAALFHLIINYELILEWNILRFSPIKINILLIFNYEIIFIFFNNIYFFNNFIFILFNNINFIINNFINFKSKYISNYIRMRWFRLISYCLFIIIN